MLKMGPSRAVKINPKKFLGRVDEVEMLRIYKLIASILELQISICTTNTRLVLLILKQGNREISKEELEALREKMIRILTDNHVEIIYPN